MTYVIALLYIALGVSWWNDELGKARESFKHLPLFEHWLFSRMNLLISTTFMLLLWPINVVSRIWGSR